MMAENLIHTAGNHLKHSCRRYLKIKQFCSFCYNAITLTYFHLHSGFPSPTITWSKLRSPLPWRHKVVNNSLVLPAVGRQDSGEYICTATNNMGTTEVTVMLDVESECCAFVVCCHFIGMNCGAYTVSTQCLIL